MTAILTHIAAGIIGGCAGVIIMAILASGATPTPDRHLDAAQAARDELAARRRQQRIHREWQG